MKDHSAQGTPRTLGTSALTLREDEHHGQQREDPLGTSRHVSREHGGVAPQPPRGSEDEPQLVGSGHRLPLLPAFPGLTFLLDFLLQSPPPNEGREMRLA